MALGYDVGKISTGCLVSSLCLSFDCANLCGEAAVSEKPSRSTDVYAASDGVWQLFSTHQLVLCHPASHVLIIRRGTRNSIRVSSVALQPQIQHRRIAVVQNRRIIVTRWSNPSWLEYITDLCIPCQDSRLRSAARGNFQVRGTNLKLTTGAFSVAGPRQPSGPPSAPAYVPGRHLFHMVSAWGRGASSETKFWQRPCVMITHAYLCDTSY